MRVSPWYMYNGWYSDPAPAGAARGALRAPARGIVAIGALPGAAVAATLLPWSDLQHSCARLDVGAETVIMSARAWAMGASETVIVMWRASWGQRA